MTGRPIFVLGVGAPKAGTTWLHRALSQAPQADFGPLKEYHIWDVLDRPDFFGNFRVTDTQIAKAADRPERQDALRLRARLHHDPDAYAAHFRGLVAQPGITLTGDITPAYCALEANRFVQIRAALEGAGFDLRVIFAMRDPVERLWSGIRMEQRNLSRAGGPTQDPRKAIEQHFTDPQRMIRSDYPRTIAALEAAFDPAQLLFPIYEEMFTAASLARLTAFTGCPIDPALTAQKFNAGKTSEGALPAALRAKIAARYRPIYDYCHARFPQTRTLWPMSGI